jgi:FkbM family methyltransferase
VTSGREEERKVRIGGKVYRLVSDDDYLMHFKGVFEPHTVRLLTSLVSQEDCIMDVGANIGCTSILFGGLARRVVAFEPSPSTFAFLERNIATSGLKNIEPQNFGLGAEARESEITFAPSNRSGAFVSNTTRASAGHVRERIVVRRLDDVVLDLHIPRIELIKIDVEGFEKSVLEGGQEVIHRLRPIVVLELNHWCLNAFQRICVPDFLDYLRSVFPIVVAIEERATPIFTTRVPPME